MIYEIGTADSLAAARKALEEAESYYTDVQWSDAAEPVVINKIQECIKEIEDFFKISETKIS